MTMNGRSAVDAGEPPPGWHGDPLLRVTAYRVALRLGARVHGHARLVDRDGSLRGVGAQLVRAVGSIGANLTEGYGRASGRDRARYVEYALGSTREARHWYLIVRAALSPADFERSTQDLATIARLLLASLPRERRRDVTKVAGSRG